MDSTLYPAACFFVSPAPTPHSRPRHDRARCCLNFLNTLAHRMIMPGTTAVQVPLTSPGPAANEYTGGASGLCGWGEWSAEESGSSDDVSWRDEDSPSYEPNGVKGDDNFSLTDAGPTRTTATMTPSTREGTLSSRDGTPAWHTRTPSAGARGLEGVGEGAVSSDQEGSRTLQRAPSTCGFAPGSRGSCGAGGGGSSAGGLFAQPQFERRRWQAANGSSRGRIDSTDHDFPVVAFHDAYTDVERGRVCMVMEYMDGGTLQQFLARREALSEPSIAAVARSVLRGLAEMHAKYKIHRDIKPSNILLDRQGRVKISDFGVVRQLNQTGSLAQTFTGTLAYMSPERIKDLDYSYPSDVWSLGMVGYWCFFLF